MSTARDLMTTEFLRASEYETASEVITTLGRRSRENLSHASLVGF
jgi:hypothetical protein